MADEVGFQFQVPKGYFLISMTLTLKFSFNLLRLKTSSSVFILSSYDEFLNSGLARELREIIVELSSISNWAHDVKATEVCI